MKYARILFTLLITSMLLLPFMNFATAATPSYVGIEKGDELIWFTTFDDGPYKDYLEDYYEYLGFDPESYFVEQIIDNITDGMFDDEFDEDVVAWRLRILKFEEEDEEDDNDYVEYECSIYVSEVRGPYGAYGFDWELEDDDEEGRIWEFDAEFYADRISLTQGLFYVIAANNIKWDKLAKEVNEEWEDDWDGDDEKASCQSESSMFFFMQRENGISTVWNPDKDDFDDHTSISQYRNDGVLLYYRWAYDGETIFEFTLQNRMIYIWWWAAAVVAAAAVIIIVIVVVVKKS